jgi:hypothetical protein
MGKIQSARAGSVLAKCGCGIRMKDCGLYALRSVFPLRAVGLRQLSLSPARDFCHSGGHGGISPAKVTQYTYGGDSI